MNVTSIRPYNNVSYNNTPNNVYNPNYKRQEVQFTGNVNALSNPFKKGYNKLVGFIRDQYFMRIINSNFMEWLLKKTDNVENMSTHMMVIGSTLISGMYAVRTLQNDKLDQHKRRTLALNDFLTWGLSTFGAYALDKSLNKKWEGVTRRFAAEYIKKHTDSEYIKQFDEKQAALKAEAKAKGIEYKAPEFTPHELAQKCKENNITPYNLNQRILEEANKASVDNYKVDIRNKQIEILNAKLPDGKKMAFLEKRPAIKNVKDFNVEVLKYAPLTNKLKGMNAIKSIFIFGMMYRYIVPVLVMKPANKLGNYIHQKNAEKEQQTQKA